MFVLSNLAKDENYHLDCFDVVDSTNNIAVDKFKKFIDGQSLSNVDKSFIIAQEQTQGRGRRGRLWHSPKRNLYISLLLCENFTSENAVQLGFIASLSVVEALQALARDYKRNPILFKIKWPNDILLDNGKISGNLVELIHYKGKLAAIVGIGVNIQEKYEQAEYKTAHLHEYGVTASPEQTFEYISHYWALNFSRWTKEGGVETIRQRWVDNVAGLGKTISVKLDASKLEGLFQAIDDDFQLLLKQKNNEIKKISTGDIYFDSNYKRQDKA